MDNVTCCDIPMRMLSDCWLRSVQDALCKVTEWTMSLAVISRCECFQIAGYGQYRMLCARSLNGQCHLL